MHMCLISGGNIGDNYEAAEQWKWRQQGKGSKSCFPRCGSKHMHSYFSEVTAMMPINLYCLWVSIACVSKGVR